MVFHFYLGFFSDGGKFKINVSVKETTVVIKHDLKIIAKMIRRKQKAIQHLTLSD